MRRNTSRSTIKLSVLSLLAVSLLALSNCSESDRNLKFIDSIPDLTQTKILGRASGDGQMYCAPVAVSNTIAWLIGNTKTQQKLAIQLASKNYMATSIKSGTGTVGVTRGIANFFPANNIKSLQYQGWRKHDAKYWGGSKIPTKAFVRSHVGANKGAWINLGWYKKQNGNLKRIGGHWVTLTGYNFGGSSKLFINDPSPRAGNEPMSHELSIQLLSKFRLIGKKHGLPRHGEGHWQVVNGLIANPKADVTLIDGIVGLELSQ
ncbi:MAG: hypothetical protein COC17_05890 [Hyphomicrobiales bacterium]|nr:MAG: hypothetical protein COC17_05890 [Hyphomicrobiales bacterium]